MANVVSVDLMAAELRDITCTFEVSRLDDEAVFICGDAETLGFTTHMPSAATLTLRVQCISPDEFRLLSHLRMVFGQQVLFAEEFVMRILRIAAYCKKEQNNLVNPRSLTLHSVPADGMQEDSAKVIMCKTDEGGANPPANITWKHLSPLGAIEPLTNDMQYNQEVTQARRGGFVTRSNLTLTARRELNGHRIECAVESPDRVLLFRQTETLEVFCFLSALPFPPFCFTTILMTVAPNSVRIHPVPTGGVREGDWVQLTCAVSVSHPPATIRWFEFPAAPNAASTAGREITDLAQIDMTQGEFGGMLVDSTLRVSKTFRTNANTEYRCIVHQPALRAPVIAEYQLNVLCENPISDPPIVEIISLPPDPTVAQSVTLSCLAHGGNPQEDMRFSWKYAKTLDLAAYRQSSSANMDPVFAKTIVGALNTSQMAALFSTMQQKPGQLHRHLMLDSVDVDNMGWYGCEVNNAGGSAQTLHLLLADFAPRMRTETKFIQHAEIGMPSELVLVVDTRPSRADVTWFWIEEGSSLANKARSKILAQRDGADVYDSGVTRLSRSPAAATGNTSPLKVVSTSSEPWLGRVRKSSMAVAPDRLKVSLSFREVLDSDFGIYMCQLNHKAGSREFYFELKPQSAARGIKPESVKISSDGRIARLEFEPPNSQYYSRIVLRICLAVKHATTALSGSAGTLRPLTGPAFLRPADQSRRLEVATGSAAREKDAPLSEVSGEGECTDYQVTFAELGYLQVEIERPISEYTFQFLVYMDSELKQVTRPVRWTREPKQVDTASQKFFIQLIIGILTTLIAVCLLVLTVYYISSSMKRRGHKKMTVDLTNGVHPSLRPYQILEPNKPITVLGTGQGSIGAESGSLQPLYPRQSIGSSCPSAKGLFAAQNLSLTTSPTMLDNTHFQLHNSSSVGSQMSTLTQRLISEVYMAAAKAASRAVTESIASSSIDGVEIQDRHHHRRQEDGGSVFRRSPHYAESGSITGGSLSGMEGLSNYQANQIAGTLRSTSVNETASHRSNTPRFRKSPATSTISPNSDQVFQFGQRRTSMTSNGHQNWSPLPMFTPNATRRLNEAASALAAAATAAVLEATQASPLPLNSAVSVGPQISRFGSTSMTAHATSSEDGESTNSSTFFPRKRGPHDIHNGGQVGVECPIVHFCLAEPGLLSHIPVEDFANSASLT
ncbi:unnamed protein product [Schistocephalus solidus]|uniref:Cell adhesion molecule 1 n=1 Tax=Schistocephalus solidus TaxID=70667 RepID=A0A183SSB0_SCHSO|nr:unnamed protein product [Schistocephalus solidus]